MDNNAATFGEFARRLGCKRSYVTALRKAGRLVLTEDGKVRVPESLARIDATRDPSKAGVSARHAAQRGAPLDGNPATPPTGADAATPAPMSPDAAEYESSTTGYQHWKERNERAKALAQERENALAEGKLLDAQDAARTIADAVTSLRTRLESLPDILGPQLAAMDDEQRARALLASEIEHALDDCARRFHTVAKEPA